MPRRRRMYLPDVPAHVVQRGNNRQACFFCEDDYLYYRQVLAEGMKRYGVALHAYVLMSNHVHLLLTPVDAVGISRLMQHAVRQYVLYINKIYRRSGTMWEGRHKASLIQAESHLFTCMRYIEMNPVTAGMVQSPDQYRWSSYRHHAWGDHDALVTDHDLVIRLAQSPEDRQCAYRAIFQSHLGAVDANEIRDCVAGNLPLGNDRFREAIEEALGRRIGFRHAGRPSRSNAPK
jgi:putative transposase